MPVMKRSKESLILVSRIFGFGAGGIQTYLNNISKCWFGSVSIFSNQCILDNNNPNLYRFESTKQHTLIIYFYLLKVLLNNKNFIKSCKLFVLLIMNRNIAKNTYDRIIEISKRIDLKSTHDTQKTIICSLLMNDSVTGIILKLKFNFRNILLTHGSEFNVNYKCNHKMIIKFILNNSEIIANSNYIKTRITEFGGNEKSIRVVNLGVDTNIFYPDIINREKSFSNINNNDYVILTIAHLVYHKGIDIGIKAVNILKSKYNIKYIVIGYGDYEFELKKMTKKMNLEKNIIFLGKIINSDLNKYINLCDIFLLPSRYEGFGISLIEASACRKPLIGCNTGGIPDAIIENKTGLLFKKESAEDLANKISYLIENEQIKKEFANNAYERTQNELNWKNVVFKIQFGLL